MPRAIASYVYDEEDFIGRGNFGVVYRGCHIKTKEVVAIKIARKHEHHEEAHSDEVGVLRTLSREKHENIVYLFKYVEKDPTTYFIMEYCNYGDLRKFLDQSGKFEDEESLKYIFRQIAHGLCFIAQTNVVHRDLKPENILLHNPQNKPHPEIFDLVPKIADFGIARYIRSREMAQTLVGSLSYMAPEVITQRSYDKKADSWSYGVMLYECYTGNVPYQVKNLIDCFVLYIKPDFKLSLPKEYPVLLADLLAHLVNPMPEMRLDPACIIAHPWFSQTSMPRSTSQKFGIPVKNLPLKKPDGVDPEECTSFETIVSTSHEDASKLSPSDIKNLQEEPWIMVEVKDIDQNSDTNDQKCDKNLIGDKEKSVLLPKNVVATKYKYIGKDDKDVREWFHQVVEKVHTKNCKQ